jgi:hypothetical protein
MHTAFISGLICESRELWRAGDPASEEVLRRPATEAVAVLGAPALSALPVLAAPVLRRLFAGRMGDPLAPGLSGTVLIMAMLWRGNEGAGVPKSRACVASRESGACDALSRRTRAMRSARLLHNGVYYKGLALEH